jgi:hypothetical protein
MGCPLLASPAVLVCSAQLVQAKIAIASKTVLLARKYIMLLLRICELRKHAARPADTAGASAYIPGANESRILSYRTRQKPSGQPGRMTPWWSV